MRSNLICFYLIWVVSCQKNSLPNLNCPYILHAFLWRCCNNKVLLSVVKHGPRELSFMLLLGCFGFIFICFKDKNTRHWVERLPALIARGHKFNPTTSLSNTRSGWHTCNLNTGEQGQELSGAPLNWFCTFSHTSDSTCVGQFVESLFYSFDVCGFSECYTVLNTTNCWDQMARLTHLFFSEKFSLFMESCWGINIPWRCSHKKVFHAPMQSTHKSRLSELFF